MHVSKHDRDFGTNGNQQKKNNEEEPENVVESPEPDAREDKEKLDK